MLLNGQKIFLILPCLILYKNKLQIFLGFCASCQRIARERSNEDYGYGNRSTVTIGGTGFGVMAIVATDNENG